MKTALLFAILLAACSKQGKDGRQGEDGQVVFPPGKGYNLITKCEHSWTEKDFRYKTIYVVREKEDDKARVAAICNTMLADCPEENFSRQEYPVSSLGYSKAIIDDGMVKSGMVGRWQSVMTNLYNKTVNVDCDGSGD